MRPVGDRRGVSGRIRFCAGSHAADFLVDTCDRYSRYRDTVGIVEQFAQASTDIHTSPFTSSAGLIPWGHERSPSQPGSVCPRARRPPEGGRPIIRQRKDGVLRREEVRRCNRDRARMERTLGEGDARGTAPRSALKAHDE